MAKDPDLSVEVTHSLTDEEARERMSKMFDATFKKYGSMAKELFLEKFSDELWKIKVSAYGFNVSGAIIFSAGKVRVVSESLPMMIRMAKGKVIGLLKPELERFLR